MFQSRSKLDATFDVNTAKGPVFSTAIVSGVMAAKKTSDLIPFCHSLNLDKCDITINKVDEFYDTTVGRKATDTSRICLQVECVVSTSGRTGVEMEALVGATASALCIYDMLKAVSHDILISDVCLMHKSGGKTTFNRGAS